MLTEEKLKALFDEALSTKLDEIKKALDEKVDTHFKELGLEKASLQDLFAKAKSNEDKEAEKKQKIASFVKAVYKKDGAAIEDITGKQMSESVGSEGGFLVPTEFRSEVYRIMSDYGLIRKFATIFPMGSDSLQVPTVATSVSVTWPSENNPGTKTKPKYNNANLSAKTAVGLTIMSNELLKDASVNIIDHIMDLYAEALAGEEDYQGFAGTGSPFAGVLNSPDVNLVTMGSGDTSFSNVDLDDLRDMISQVNGTVLPTSAYYMHQEVWAVIQKIQEDGKHISVFQNPIVPMDSPNGGAGNSNGLRPVGYIWGYPVYVSDKLPGLSADAAATPFIVFGSLKKGIFFGDREQMALSVSDSATVDGEEMFANNQSAMRVTERVAITVGLPEALVTLKTAAS